MLEFIITTCFIFVLAFLGFTAIEYYVNKQPPKESIISGLFIGILFTVSGIAFRYYQLITAGIITGITVSLLVTVIGYYVHKVPLKNSIIWGLIMGIGVAIVFPILWYLIDFLFDLIL